MMLGVQTKKEQVSLPLGNYVAVAEIKLSEEYVKQSELSKETYKMLTLNVMDTVLVSGDTKTMHNVAAVVAKWNKVESEWVGTLLTWVKSLEDARELLICENNSVTEIVVIVDDSTKDHVLDYNEFLFDIREKYTEVHDFMIIDDELKAALPAMYTQVTNIYKRGE